jgi:cell division protein FtsZ
VSGKEAELQMDELSEITDFMQDLAGDEADVIFGHGVDDQLGESIRLTIIATGFEGQEETPIAVEKPVARLEETERTIYNLDEDRQTSLFEEENKGQSGQMTSRVVPQENPSEDTFEQDFQKKLDAFQFEKPEQRDPVPTYDAQDDSLDIELRELLEETQTTHTSMDQPLEELDGMAHPPSRKVILMQQSEERRRQLSEIKSEDSIDTASYKEKFDVPAYQRKKVSLKDAPSAEESLVSKYNLNGENQLGNNKFLHDRPD